MKVKKRVPYSETRRKQRERIESIVERAAGGEALSDIAHDLGVTRQRIDQIIRNELARLARESEK